MRPSVTAAFPSRAVIREVGLRDGLQSIATILPTETKKQWVKAAYEAGMREIEVGSYVPARLLPQLADTADVLAYARTLPGLVASVLVPNLRKAPDEVVAEFARIRAARDATRSNTIIEGAVSTAFGCTIQGYVDPEEVLRLVQALLDSGADRISVADTVGYADPRMVRELFERVRRIAGDRFCCGHFHDTRGMAMANVYAALETGVARFDASLAGIGGCPYALGASGNATTEDLAYMLASMGVETGIDLERLLQLRERVAGWLEGETTHGTVWRAGLPKTMKRAAPRAE